MIQNKNLEKIYDIVISGEPLSKKRLKSEMSFAELSDLVKSGYLKHMGFFNPLYNLVNIEGLFEYGLSLKGSNDDKAIKCFHYAHDNGVIEATHELFYKCVLEGNFVDSIEYLEVLLSSVQGESKKLYNFYLYLLSYIIMLPEDLREYMKGLTEADCGEPYCKEDGENTTFSKMRFVAIKGNFPFAKKLLFQLVRDKQETKDDLITIKLIKTASTIQLKENLSMLKLIDKGDYLELEKIFENLARQRKLYQEEIYFIAILQEIIKIIKTSIVPVVKSYGSQNFDEALENSDFKKAWEIVRSKGVNGSKKNLNKIRVILEQLLMILENKRPKTTFDKEEKYYVEGKKFLLSSEFYQAYTCFHKCLEINPFHKGANFEVFVENVYKKDYSTAFDHLGRVYLETDEERDEVKLYLYLLNHITDVPKNLTWRTDIGPQNEDIIHDLCIDKKFLEAQRFLEDRCSDRKMNSQENLLSKLLNRAYLKIDDDDLQVSTYAQNKEFEKIIEHLKWLDTKRGLSTTEKYMLQIAKDIIFIRRNKKLLVQESIPQDFISALDSRDYEAALNAKDVNLYFSDASWSVVTSLLKQMSFAIAEKDSNKTSEELFDDGEKHWKDGEFSKAYECYRKCFEFDDKNKECIKKLFVYCILIKNYDLAAHYFAYWNEFSDQEEQAEHNIYLYLLNHIVELPEELQKKAKKMTFNNLGGLYEGTDGTGIVMQKVRSLMLNKSFSLGAKLIKGFEAKRKLTLHEEITQRLLLEAVFKQRTRQNEMTEFIESDNYKGFIDYAKSTKNRCGASQSAKYSIILAELIVEIKETGEIPQVLSNDSKNIFEAIDNKDFEAIERINKEYNATYSRADVVLNLLLTNAIKLINEIKEGRKLKDMTLESNEALETSVSEPSVSEELYISGKKLYEQHNFYEAYVSFKKCLELDPNHKGAAFELFVQSIDLQAYSKAIDYFRIMKSSETEEEKTDNRVYLYLLNYLLTLPEDLKVEVEDISDIKLIGTENLKRALYTKIYMSAKNKSFRRSLGMLKDLTDSYGFSSKDQVLWKLLSFSQTLLDSYERDMKTCLKNKDYEGILALLDASSKKMPLSPKEQAIHTITNDLIEMQKSETIPTKTLGNSFSPLRAIENRDYRVARRLNRKLQLTHGRQDDILAYFLDEIIGKIEEIKKGHINSAVMLTQEESISIDDMCGSGLIPDMVATIKSGVLLESAFEMYRAKWEERIIVQIILADHSFSRGDFDAGNAYLENIDDVGCRTDLLGKYYRHVAACAERQKKLLIDKVTNGGE